jgi:hypothetical protein
LTVFKFHSKLKSQSTKFDPPKPFLHAQHALNAQLNHKPYQFSFKVSPDSLEHTHNFLSPLIPQITKTFCLAMHEANFALRETSKHLISLHQISAEFVIFPT